MNRWLNFFLTFFLLIAFLSGLLGANLILISSLLFLFIIIFAHLWNSYAFNKFKFKCKLKNSKVEFGKKINYILEIENKKFLPLLWLKIENYINKNFEFLNDTKIKNDFGKDYNTFNDTVTVKWYEKIKRSYQFIPKKRGLFYFGEGHIQYHGILGLFQNHLKMDHSTHLIVYPRIISLSRLNLSQKELFGVKPKKGWIYKDPLNKVGVKPYNPSDSFKDINWKASARHQKLETNIYQPALRRELHILLLNPGNQSWWEKKVENNLELVIIYTASIIEQSLKHDLKLNFSTNFSAKKIGSNINLNIDKPISQREKIMTTLALLQPYSNRSVETVMQTQQKNIKKGARVIIVSLGINKTLKKMLKIYNKYYDPILILKDKKKDHKNINFIPVYYIKEDSWNEIEKMELVNGN